MKFVVLKTFLLASYFFSIGAAFAQHKYAPFVVNEKIGIVEINTLAEYVPPSFDYYKRVAINNDYIAFRNNDSLKLFDKRTGAWRKPIPMNTPSPVFDIDQKLFLHLVENNRSVVLDSNFTVSYRFEKIYSELKAVKHDYLYAKHEGNIDIFTVKKHKPKLLYSINATDSSKETQYLGTDQKLERIVFFGGDQTYIFDGEMKLVKTVDAKIVDRTRLFAIINPQFNHGPVSNEGPRYEPRKSAPEEFKKTPFNEKNVYTSQVSTFNILTNQDFDLRSEDSKTFTIYKVFTTTDARGVKSTMMGSKNSYIFTIQRNTLKPLLPIKYQSEIGLEVVLK